MIRREFLIVSSVSALAAALPAAWTSPEATAAQPGAEWRSAPAAEQWRAEQLRREWAIPARQERYRWQL
jgi:hypothetical protein